MFFTKAWAVRGRREEHGTCVGGGGVEAGKCPLRFVGGGQIEVGGHRSGTGYRNINQLLNFYGILGLDFQDLTTFSMTTECI